MDDQDPREIILNSPMSWFQMRGIATVFGLNALDGFDLLSITFVAPSIAREWRIDAAIVGLLISSGLAGMVLGSLALAPFADRVGRRPIALLSLVAMSLGMLLSAFANTSFELMCWRFLTGLGIGAIIPSFTALTAEYANARRRALAVSVSAVGFPIGALTGGTVAAWLLDTYDWRSVFIVGGIVSVLFIPIVWRTMPESIEFLLLKRSHSALQRINLLLAHMGKDPVKSLPMSTPECGRLLDLFRGKMLAITTVILGAYFLHSATYYYAITWIPPIVADLGFSVSMATEVSVWANIGGAFGGLAMGLLSMRLPVRAVMIAMLTGTAIMVVVFGRTPPDLGLLKAAATLLGFCQIACIVGFYALMATSFPTSHRVAGTGFVIGVGRLGSIFGPLVGGYLFASGMVRSDVALFMAVGSLAAATILWGAHHHRASRSPAATPQEL